MSKQRPSRISATPTTIAIACGLVALITVIWAVVNQSRIDNLQDEVDSVRADIAVLRENANATRYVFEVTDTSPADLNGVAYLGTTGSGVVVIGNLPPAGDNEVYQIWLVNSDESASSAGNLFVAGNGQGFGLIPADATGYKNIAISLEPNGGSESPSGGFLLVAEVNAGRGSQPQPMASLQLCQNLWERSRVCQ